MPITHTIRAAFADGTEIDTFDQVAITHDMLAAGSAWTLALWYSATAHSTWDILQDKARNGALVTISVDDTIQLVGMIETRSENESRTQGEVMVISGRDLTGIALDWDADPRIHLNDDTLENVLAAIFEPTGLRVTITEAAAAREVQGIARRRHGNGARAIRRQRINRFRVKPHETMWQVADRVCRELGYLIWAAPMIDTNTLEVIVDAPLETGDPTFRFDRIANGDGTFHGNILTGSHVSSIRGIPTEVTGFAHTAMTEHQDAPSQITVFNDRLTGPLVVPDPIPQPRFLTSQQAHSQDTIQREAQREIARAMAKFRRYECDVQGLSQSAGDAMRIYTINTLAHVRDDRRRIDEDMLMTSVTLKRSRKEAGVATISMAPKGAIRVIPEPS